jgi:hypothetical protein
VERHERHSPATLGNASYSISLALMAGLCWAVAIALLLMGDLRTQEAFFAPLRIIFYLAILLAGWLTFVPAERRLELPGLALQGIGGSLLLLYTLAFVPPPTGWLFSLPDTPIYLLLIVSLFFVASAIAMPIVYLIGLRIFSNRARQLDLKRVRRQSHEVGTLVGLVAILAGLRIFTWVSLLLLILILVIAELLFLSRVEPPSPDE